EREQHRGRLRRVEEVEGVGDEVDPDRRAGGRAGVLDPEGHVQNGRDTEQVWCAPALHEDLAAADVQCPEGSVSREGLVPVDETTTLDARRGLPANQRRGLGGGPIHDGGQPLERSGSLPKPGEAPPSCPKAPQRRLLQCGDPGLVELLQFAWTGLLSHGLLLVRLMTLASVSIMVDIDSSRYATRRHRPVSI